MVFAFMYQIKLSPYAKIFYTEWLLSPASSIYNIVIDQTFYGNLDVVRLRDALTRYVAEHVILNSHIQNVGSDPCWVKNDCISELEYLDDSGDNIELLPYVSSGFDLHHGPLYRFRLLRLSDGVYRFVIVLHHIVVDGSSGDDGLFQALSHYYNDECYKAKYSIDEQIKLISDLTALLDSDLERKKAKYQEFWRHHLAGIEGVDLKFLKLDRDNGSSAAAGKHNFVGEIRFSYAAAELIKFSHIKHKYVITPYIYSLCIFALLVNRYTSQQQLAISYATAIKEGIPFIYGAQVNTNFIPYRFDQVTTIVDLFNQSKEFFKSLKQDNVNHGYYPVTDIISESNKSLLNLYFIQPNFKDTMFTFAGITKVTMANEFNLDAVDPLVFEQALGDKNKLSYRVRFDKRVIDEELLNNFVSSFKRLFLAILDDLANDHDSTALSSYDILDRKQYQQLIDDFNQTKSSYPQDKSLAQLFAEQVQRTPNNVAVIFNDIQITYRQLDEITQQLAGYLSKLGVKAREPVALYLQRSLDSVVATIGVIKAGACYVPLDPAYPQSRIRYMIKDAGCRFCLTSDELFNQCNLVLSQDQNFQQKVSVVRIADADETHGNAATTAIVYDQSPLDVAYIMYTSGSTGEPKGIEIPHRGIVRLVKNTNYLTFEQNTRMAHTTSISFDISTVEIWGSLLNGLTMVVIAQDTLSDTKGLAKLLQQQSVAIMCMAPVLFNAMISTYDAALSSLKFLLICGEKLSPKNIARFFASNKFATLMNCYGPTESTSYATVFEIPRGWSDTKEIPIGKPIANTTAYVLDRDLHLLPIGAVGELCLGGDGLAICYHHKPELTKDKFVSVTLGRENGVKVRVYKTGDLVRMRPDGNLEFIGRNDFQVKIRGYRVELGEIEVKLVNYPGIKDAVVLAKEYLDDISKNTNEKYLVAYYVADRQLDEVAILDYLAAQLPKYMLPSVVIYLEKLPITANGKLDRKALPEPKFEHHDQSLTLPSNEKERLICEIFAKTLGLETIGIDDDFFKLGGNSLKAISLVSILQDHFDIKVADIFNLRTTRKLAGVLSFTEGVLKRRLEQVKLAYQNRPRDNRITSEQVKKKIDYYLKDVQNWKIDCSLKKPITNVLLTGATGYLGCNILNQLLKLTDYNIFLLVRANSQAEAVDRVNKKFQFYFDRTLDDVCGLRVFIIKSDIEKSDLGLSPREYQDLAAKIDSIIHAAALVKHYGEYDKSYSANVQATINMLELAKLTKLKDFHYMSTCAVLNFGFVQDRYDDYIFTEDDIPLSIEKYYNVYSKTKLHGEYQIVKYREYGVNGSIYRLGNLLFMAENFRGQENTSDSAFVGFLQFLFKMQCITPEFSMVEISPVDFTAQVVVKLFEQQQLDNSIYHLSNPYLFNLSDFFINNGVLSIKALTIEQLIDNIAHNFSNEIYHDVIIRFLLSQAWLDEFNARENSFSATNRILQNRTQHILKQLGFEWSPVTDELFGKYLSLLKL